MDLQRKNTLRTEQLIKKLFLKILVISLLFGGSAYSFGDVSYVCEWDGDSGDKDLYQIKKNKYYQR